jgi:hypothetical protein
MESITPDGRFQFFAGNNLSGSLPKADKEVKLGTGQVEFLPIGLYMMPLLVNDKRPGLNKSAYLLAANEAAQDFAGIAIAVFNRLNQAVLFKLAQHFNRPIKGGQTVLFFGRQILPKITEMGLGLYLYQGIKLASLTFLLQFLSQGQGLKSMVAGNVEEERVGANQVQKVITQRF